MNRIGQIFCLCMLGFIFSCETDTVFDENNREDQLVGVWQVRTIESDNYSSTMVSPNGESNTSRGTFEGNDIDMTLVFNADGTFQTTGDYNQVLMIESALPDPIVIESRTNDFQGGGTWEIVGSVLRVRTTADSEFQPANLNFLDDTELDIDYNYNRVIVEGTVTRTVDVIVNYNFEKE